MPIFDYKCDTCGEVIEEYVHRFDAEVTCKSCNKVMRKLYNGINVVFDGNMNGGDRGKKIQSKNNSLKDKYAGYSYEQESIRQKVTKQVDEKISKL